MSCCIQPIRCLPAVLVVVVLLDLAWATSVHAQDNRKLVWPEAGKIEAQPLLAQVGRLTSAMKFVGSPLSRKTRDAIDQLAANMADQKVTDAVESILDPLCLASVVIEKDGSVLAVAGKAKPELLQEGWRHFLVKVVNRAELATALYVSSPNSGDKPGAPAEEVKQRWMEVSMFDGRPLTPQLSGLGLEYRILQAYSSKPGEGTGRLEFRIASDKIGSGKDPNVLEEWTFEDGLQGWKGVEGLEHVNGTVQLTGKKPPTYIERIAPMPKIRGKLELRFWMHSPVKSRGTIFWADGPLGKGQIGQAPFSIQAAAAKEYRVTLETKNDLAGVRIVAPAGTRFDWIRLARFTKRPPPKTAIAIPFQTVPATKVTLKVLDEKLRPTTAAFLVRDQKGHVYPTQSKRLAPDFFFHPQVYRSDGEALDLPPGRYTVLSWRGPESIPRTQTLEVGNQPITLGYRVQRWVDPAKYGWYSGDHHIHAAGCAHYQNPTQGVHAPDMALHCRGEDLKVGCNLTWGPCFDYQKQFFTGKVAEVSQYPYLLRYDVEVSGFGSHASGHLCLLRLRDQIYPGGESKDHWPTLGLNTLKWAKAQGAICGPAHSSAGLQVTSERVEGKDGPPLQGWKPFGGPRAKSVVQLPNYFIPAYNGIGANEFIVDITHQVPGPDGKLVPAVDFISSMNTDRVAEWNMWYHTLNCGFRAKTSGETDFPCVTGDRVGIGRVYVKVNGKLNYDDWCQGISEGRSYVSDGSAHLMDLAASFENERTLLGEAGSELKLDEEGKIILELKAAVRKPGQSDFDIEVIQNGLPVKKKSIPADGSEQKLRFEVTVKESSWLAIRAGASAHTNPIFVIAGKKPIRASVASAEWCLKGVDQCWKAKQATYAAKEQEDAKAAYDHARKVYQQILAEAKARQS